MMKRRYRPKRHKKKNSLLSVERNQAIKHPQKGMPLLRLNKVYCNWDIPARVK